MTPPVCKKSPLTAALITLAFPGFGHARTSATIVVSERLGTDSGKWAYVISPSSPDTNGVVFIDCTHFDAKGSVWTSY